MYINVHDLIKGLLFTVFSPRSRVKHFPFDTVYLSRIAHVSAELTSPFFAGIAPQCVFRWVCFGAAYVAR